MCYHMTMRNILKKYFIPNDGNNYHPHILHAKRTFFYGAIFSLAKIILVAFVCLLPAEVFVMPDVLAEEGRQIIALTNEIREERGLPILKVEEKLNTSAQLKSDDMAIKEYFAHSESNQTVTTWLKSAGYKYSTAGENLAVGYSSALDIVTAWKNSGTHYANLIDTDFTDLGVGLSGGVFDGQPTVYIAQHLASPLAVVVDPIVPASVVVSEPVVIKLEEEIKNKIVDKIPEPSVGMVPELVTEFSNEKEKTNEISENVPEQIVELAPESLVLAEKVDNVRPTVEPVVNLTAPTPMQKYVHAKSVLSPITSIFDVSRNIYLVAILFFAVALLLNIFVEIRKQHPHAIFHTSCLIALLIVFWKF